MSYNMRTIYVIAGRMRLAWHKSMIGMNDLHDEWRDACASKSETVTIITVKPKPRKVA